MIILSNRIRINLLKRFYSNEPSSLDEDLSFLDIPLSPSSKKAKKITLHVGLCVKAKPLLWSSLRPFVIDLLDKTVTDVVKLDIKINLIFTDDPIYVISEKQKDLLDSRVSVLNKDFTNLKDILTSPKHISEASSLSSSLLKLLVRAAQTYIVIPNTEKVVDALHLPIALNRITSSYPNNIITHEVKDISITNPKLIANDNDYFFNITKEEIDKRQLLKRVKGNKAEKATKDSKAEKPEKAIKAIKAKRVKDNVVSDVVEDNT
jgi:hypothetical protein